MRAGSRITAAATTGPASGPLPASSQPATGTMPRLMARRSRRNVGRTSGSGSGRRGAGEPLRLMARHVAQANTARQWPACLGLPRQAPRLGSKSGVLNPAGVLPLDWLLRAAERDAVRLSQWPRHKRYTVAGAEVLRK